MRELVAQAGLDQSVTVDSAGTGDWHVGDPPDRRTVEAARRRGFRVDGSAAQFSTEHFARFDYVIAMDRSNRDALQELAPDAAARDKISLLLSWSDSGEADVPDPYFGGPSGFERVIDLCEQACASLLSSLVRQHHLSGTPGA